MIKISGAAYAAAVQRGGQAAGTRLDAASRAAPRRRARAAKSRPAAGSLRSPRYSSRFTSRQMKCRLCPRSNLFLQSSRRRKRAESRFRARQATHYFYEAFCCQRPRLRDDAAAIGALRDVAMLAARRITFITSRLMYDAWRETLTSRHR